MKINLFFALSVLCVQTGLAMEQSQPIQMLSSSTSEEPAWDNSPPAEIETGSLSPAEKLLIALQKKLTALPIQKRVKLSRQLKGVPQRNQGGKKDELFDSLLKEFQVTKEEKMIMGGIPLATLRHSFFTTLLKY